MYLIRSLSSSGSLNKRELTLVAQFEVSQSYIGHLPRTPPTALTLENSSQMDP